jgi:hypothetical protein
MARGDKDIVSAVADIRADTASIDVSEFSAKSVIVSSVLYSIAARAPPSKERGNADSRR